MADEGIEKSISDRQCRFVQEYTIDFNGAQAAIRAGYSSTGAAATASRLLANHNVRGELASVRKRALQKYEEEAIATRQQVLELDSAIALLDPLDVLEQDEAGSITVRKLETIPINARRCIASMENSPNGFKIRFLSPHPSIERLAKFHGIIGPTALRQVEEDIEPEDAYGHAVQAAVWMEDFAHRHGVTTIEEMVTLLRRKEH